MSLDAMDWVWEHSKSKGVGRLILLALADKAMPADDECKAYGSYRFLAKRANCTQGAVTEALDGLYALGELEPLKEKGPNGAAAYRLPQAIGYVRPTRGNRSAQQSDSGARGGSKSLGSAERPVLGSAERSDAESHGSAEHTTSSSPRTTTPAPSDPPAPTDHDGGGGQTQDGHTQAADFLSALPAPWTCGQSTARRLAPLLTDRTTEQGWALDDALSRKLTSNPAGVQNFAAVLRSRIDDLPKKPTVRIHQHPAPNRPPANLTAWCEDLDCDEETRHRRVIDDRGFTHTGPCPDCHPDTQKGAAA